MWKFATRERFRTPTISRREVRCASNVGLYSTNASGRGKEEWWGAFRIVGCVVSETLALKGVPLVCPRGMRKSRGIEHLRPFSDYNRCPRVGLDNLRASDLESHARQTCEALRLA